MKDMSDRNEYLHEVAVTAIVVKDGKFLIAKRAAHEKAFPNKWTVPGGKLVLHEYSKLPHKTEYPQWYNVVDRVLKKEVREEVGLEIEHVRYVTSLATEHKDGAASVVISCLADFKSGEVKLQEDETDKCEWVSATEAENYDLIDGILDELKMADALRKGEKYEWKRH